jgi:MEMO1 family protein
MRNHAQIVANEVERRRTEARLNSMIDARFRPSIRPVESIVVPDPRHGRVLVLRDTQGITETQAVLPPALAPLLVRFTGRLTCQEIAREASAEVGTPIPVEVVIRLAEELDRGLFLEGGTFREARARVEREFADAPVRPASHAGGAYHDDPRALGHYIDETCLAKAQGSPNGGRRLVGLVSPHIDPWRGATCYGHAYGALRAALPESADTFVVFGTSHAPMREPFALCRKAFATPFGPVQADIAGIDALAAAADFDPYADQFNHKREHSLEFQVVFLKHLLKGRDFRIVPVLAGLGAQQVSGADPMGDPRVERFVDGVRGLVGGQAGRVVVVAGADLAHVGPRFGDARAFDGGQRATLERADRESLARAASLDPDGFWEHVSADLEARRVCGLAPIWSLLCALGAGGADGQVLHYEQTVDREDGSIVSHAAVGFYG